MARVRPGHRVAGIVAVLLATAGTVRAEDGAAVAKAVDYLKGATGGQPPGEAAIGALALIKAEVPRTDPGLARAIKILEDRFKGSAYEPARSGVPDIYEASVTIMALGNLDAATYRPQVAAAAQHILNKQKAAGGWDYAGRTAGDTSISQYAVLGLWEAENAGVAVNPAVWDRAAAWFVSSQSPQGGWTYHRDDGSPDTLSMTAAGVGSLLICQRQLAAHKAAVAAQNPYLIPVQGDDTHGRYRVETPPARVTAAIRGGLGWIGRNFTTANAATIGHSTNYALYGIERVGALAGRENLGRVDWYERGSQYLAASQTGTGSWPGGYGDVPNTAWGVLFLVKSTAKTVEKIRLRRLGAGELFGGKGLPRDLSAISEAGGRLIARPMDGAVEGMLAVLEDPRSDEADSALAGLIARYQDSGPKALLPYRDRFRRLLSDPDPGIRRVAAWGLARSGDFDLIPALADALRDGDEAVVAEARRGLELLSRRLDGLGPPTPSTPAQREEASKAWKAWYESVRPIRAIPNAPANEATARPGL